MVTLPSKAKEPLEQMRGWWMLTMMSHGVEISITGGRQEIVCVETSISSC